MPAQSMVPKMEATVKKTLLPWHNFREAQLTKFLRRMSLKSAGVFPMTCSRCLYGKMHCFCFVVEDDLHILDHQSPSSARMMCVQTDAYGLPRSG